jgi:predicted acetyltransferase
MSVEFRQLRPDELREAVYASALGFGGSTADVEIDRRIAGRVGPDFALAAFDGGVLAAQVVTLPLSVHWNGPAVSCGGVTSVNTLPTHRRRGYVRELLTRSLAHMHETGQPVSLLWASMAAIYQRFGYGVAFTQCHAHFDARRLAFVEEITPAGQVRIAGAAEALPQLAAAYERFAALRTPMVQRDAIVWERVRRQLERWEQSARSPYLTAVYEEGNEILGYAIYGVTPQTGWHDPEERLTVYEFAWLSPAAHRALIQMFSAYDRSESVQFILLPLDDPLFYHVQEPRDLHVRLSDGAMLRIVDVQAALEARGYDADGRVTFALTDDFCPWNSGAWTLDVDAGAARVRRAAAEPELWLTPRALAMLATGYQTATTLARLGLLSCAEPRALRTADNLFRTVAAPYCLDRF